ncbi:hypothetical protein CIB93_06250 [Streptomyces sp. WZ.A104]|uniref:hypothetical protein n=1 Tax=Streptomyces sp. WZ.A104 TaxID=2023771 RepID=UPI000BBBE0BC|nr:hypothetical protein [Streptomyces sp. WZ.A104]PCG86821.1 hypothetical protein CIB93_06250 [Streptomyces sp. WZ.A104]
MPDPTPTDSARPACPACGNRPAHARPANRRRRYELWWECAACPWVGVRSADGGPLRTMRRLRDDWADCMFCGEEEANVVGEPFERDGERLDWLVCLACGRGNTRRLGPAQG